MLSVVGNNVDTDLPPEGVNGVGDGRDVFFLVEVRRLEKIQVGDAIFLHSLLHADDRSHTGVMLDAVE